MPADQEALINDLKQRIEGARFAGPLLHSIITPSPAVARHHPPFAWPATTGCVHRSCSVLALRPPSCPHHPSHRHAHPAIPGTAGESFAELAQAHSQCPSGKRGGDLGWISMGRTVPEFEQAAFSAAPRELVKVKSPFGWHLLTVLK